MRDERKRLKNCDYIDVGWEEALNKDFVVQKQ
jgi:hypothetical protein